MPYDASLGLRFDCIFCEKPQKPSPQDYLTESSLNLVTETRDAQLSMSKLIDAAYRDDQVLLVEAGTGVGKCHARGQGVLMYDGTLRNVEHVEQGDRLMGPDSRPRNVLSVSQGHGKMYDVIPTKGEPWRVNGEHILTVVFTDTHEELEVSVNDYLQWVNKRKHRAKLFRAPVTFKAATAPLPLDPYVLGLLLGDGCLGGKTDYGILFTTADPELSDAVRAYIETLGMRLVTRGTKSGCVCYRLSGTPKHPNPVAEALKKLGLYGHLGSTKFIPRAYKTGSFKDRLAILAGLMDSDGSLVKSKTGYDFVSQSKRLADDTAFVARSLGLAAYTKPCEKRDQHGNGGTYYRVGISGDCNQVPCLLPRKQASPRKQKKNVLRTGFRIEPVDQMEDYYGFTLDRDARFLLDDFTVTHNSFAYLLPAIISGQRTVITTAKKSLQSQLIEKDLPYLKKVLRAGGYNFDFAAAYGKGNFACLKKVKKEYKKAKFAAQWAWFFDNSKHARWEEEKTAYARYVGNGGKRSVKLPVAASKYNAEDCSGSECKHFKECGYIDARNEMLEADIVVANHWLVGFHLRLQRDMPNFQLLGNVDYLIVDEAHKIEDGIRAAFTYELRENALQGIIEGYEEMFNYLPASEQARLGSLELPRKRELKKAWRGMFRKVLSHTDENITADMFGPEGAELLTKVDETLKILGSPTHIQNHVGCSFSAATALSHMGPGSDGVDKYKGLALDEAMFTMWFHLQITKRRVQGISDAMSAVYNEADNRVSYLENKGKYSAICVAPIDIAPFMHSAHENIKSTMYVSATLAVNNSMKVFKNRTGVSKHDPSKVVASQFGSAFNMDKQALMYLSTQVPLASYKDDAREVYRSALAEEIFTLTHAMQGNTFVLFTARAEMEDVYEQLEMRTHHPILMQRDTSAAALLTRYRQTPSAILFGLKSFWEGVDVPGRKLSQVIITKLPFPGRSDPVTEARRGRAGDQWFQQVDLPDMILDLRQGVGRLIRTQKDVGVVSILDQRLNTKRYKTKVINSLGIKQVTNSQERVVRALKTLAARP